MGENLKSRGASVGVTLVVLAIVVVHVVTDIKLVADITSLAPIVGASVGAWIGAARAPHGRRRMGRLIAAGVSLTALGDVLWYVLGAIGATTDVSIADPPWFTSYVVLCAALWIVLRRSQGRGKVDLGVVIDAGTIVVVSLLVFWSVSVDPIVVDPTISPFVRAVWMAYPIAGAVLFALVVRVVMNRGARAVIGLSFPAGVCLWLATPPAHVGVQGGGHTALMIVDIAGMVAPVLLARAAWRVGHVVPDAPASPALGGWVAQLMVAVGPLLVPTGLELVADLRGVPGHPLHLFIGTATLITLAFVRTARLIRSEERTRRELEVARDAALEASRAKSMFLANVSHEIRTPLTTVLAAGEILEDTPLDDLQLRLLAKMHRSGELLKALVEGILDFSRLEAGQLELTPAAFDLHAMVADAADVYLPRALQSAVAFEWHLDPCVPRTVVGDPGRLFQVLSILLDNALKFTHQGRVGLVVRPARADGGRRGGEGDAVEFVVDDTGIGIREDDLESVFESFTQVDGSMTRSYGGTGLGLAICRQLTELMGGSVTVQSQFGLGSTFLIRIPLTAILPHVPHGQAVSLTV